MGSARDGEHDMAELIAAGAATAVGALGVWLLGRDRAARRRDLVPLPVRTRRRRER